MFRPGSAIPLLLISAGVVAFLLGDAVIRSGVVETILLAPWPLLALWCVYVSAFASSLAIEDEGVRVQNMLRVIRLPWPRIRDVQWRWQVELGLDDGAQVRAIGGPLQGRGGRRPGSPEQTPPGVRAQYDSIVRAFEAARERSADASDADASDAAVTRGWDVPVLAALGVLIVWALVAVVVTGGPS